MRGPAGSPLGFGADGFGGQLLSNGAPKGFCRGTSAARVAAVISSHRAQGRFFQQIFWVQHSKGCVGSLTEAAGETQVAKPYCRQVRGYSHRHNNRRRLLAPGVECLMCQENNSPNRPSALWPLGPLTNGHTGLSDCTGVSPSAPCPCGSGVAEKSRAPYCGTHNNSTEGRPPAHVNEETKTV